MVEHHGAGALQEDVVEFEPGIVHDILHAVALLEHLDDVTPALGAPVRGVHRVERHMSAGVSGDPVVGEYAVGLAGAVVVEQVHRDALCLERLGNHGHLGVGSLGYQGGIVPRVLRLKGIVICRFRVRREEVRPNQENGRGSLYGHQGQTRTGAPAVTSPKRSFGSSGSATRSMSV